jgi:hypothetical protein
MSILISYEPSIHDGNQQKVRVWGLPTPPTGNITIAPTISGGDGTIALISYTGAWEIQPEADNEAFSNNGVNNTAVTTLASSITTLSNNAWSVMFTGGGNNFPNTFTATQGTLRVTEDTITGDGAVAIIDSNGPISPAGISTLEATWSAGTGFMSNVVFSIKPQPPFSGQMMIL